MLADTASALSHPLLLVAVGAGVSGYLVPALTRRWQDHQKELEVKVALVDQVSKAVAEITIAIQFAEVGAESQTQEAFDEAYRAWEITQPTIGGRLRAYYPHSSLPADWMELARCVNQLYATTGVKDPEDRARRLRKISAVSYIDNLSPTDLWREAKSAIQAATDRLSGRILAEEIRDFNRPLLRPQRPL
jgi:hypothetical protein